MDIKGTVDVSCYLCFEATGDSEAPNCDAIIKDPNIACQISSCDDEDDAQSCCNGSPDEILINSYDPIMYEYESDEENREDEDGVEVCSYGTTYKEGDDDCEMEVEKKARVCVDSGAEKMDEMEKSRLFWEACLAS